MQQDVATKDLPATPAPAASTRKVYTIKIEIAVEADSDEQLLEMMDDLSPAQLVEQAVGTRIINRE